MTRVTKNIKKQMCYANFLCEAPHIVTFYKHLATKIKFLT